MSAIAGQPRQTASQNDKAPRGRPPTALSAKSAATETAMDENPLWARWYLRKIFEGEAQVRREQAKAIKRPFWAFAFLRSSGHQEDERRNLEAAAAVFDWLAATVADIPVDVLIAFSALDRTESAVERFGEMLSEIDLSTAPNAEDFVRRFIADQHGEFSTPSPSCRLH